jgi:DNA polymerase-3 subunit gamma/tau
MVQKNEMEIIGNEMKNEREMGNGEAQRMAQNWTEKYRPRTLDDFWQQDIAGLTWLKRKIEQGGLKQSIICVGEPGVGKSSLARVLGRRFTCLNPSHPYNPCGNCESCRTFSPNSHMGTFVHDNGYLEVDMTEFTGKRTKEDIVYWLTQRRIERFGSPCEHLPMVICLDEIAALKNDVQQRLIKTVENTRRACFIFCATDADQIIIPIKERGPQILLRPPTGEEATAGLMRIATAEGYSIDKTVARHIVESVRRVPRRCIQALEYAALFSEFKTIDLETAKQSLPLVASQ